MATEESNSRRLLVVRVLYSYRENALSCASTYHLIFLRKARGMIILLIVAGQAFRALNGVGTNSPVLRHLIMRH